MNRESAKKFLEALAIIGGVITIVVTVGEWLEVKKSAVACSSLALGVAALLVTMGQPGFLRHLLSYALVCVGFYVFIAELKFSTVQITKAIEVTNTAKTKADAELATVLSQRDQATKEVEGLNAEARKAQRDLENRKADIDQTELSLRNLTTSKQRLTDEVDALKKEELRLRMDEEKTGEIKRRTKAEADLLAAKKAEEDQAKAKEEAAAAAEAAEQRKIKQITGNIPKFPAIASGAALRLRGTAEIKKCRWLKDYFGDTYYLAYASSSAPVTVGHPREVELVTLPFDGAKISYADGLNAGGTANMLIDGNYITVSMRK